MAVTIQGALMSQTSQRSTLPSDSHGDHHLNKDTVGTERTAVNNYERNDGGELGLLLVNLVRL